MIDIGGTHIKALATAERFGGLAVMTDLSPEGGGPLGPPLPDRSHAPRHDTSNPICRPHASAPLHVHQAGQGVPETELSERPDATQAAAEGNQIPANWTVGSIAPQGLQVHRGPEPANSLGTGPPVLDLAVHEDVIERGGSIHSQRRRKTRCPDEPGIGFDEDELLVSRVASELEGDQTVVARGPRQSRRGLEGLLVTNAFAVHVRAQLIGVNESAARVGLQFQAFHAIGDHRGVRAVDYHGHSDALVGFPGHDLGDQRKLAQPRVDLETVRLDRRRIGSGDLRAPSIAEFGRRGSGNCLEQVLVVDEIEAGDDSRRSASSRGL